MIDQEATRDPNTVPAQVWEGWSESLRNASEHDLTPEILERDADDMIAKADMWARRIFLDPLATDDTEPRDEAHTPIDPVTGMGEVSIAVHLEIGEVGMVHGLFADVHPDQTVRNAAKAQMVRIQTYYKTLIADPRLHAAFAKVDPTQLDPDRRQQYDYYMGLIAGSPATTGEQATGVKELEERLDKVAGAFEAATTARVTIELTQEDLASLPPDYESHITVGRDNDVITVVLDEPTATYLQQVGSYKVGEKAYAFYGHKAEGNQGAQVVIDADQAIRDMVDARREIARLQGTTWTGMKVKGLTIGTVPELVEFRDTIAPGIIENYQTAIAALQKLRAADGKTGPMQEWELERYKQQLLDQSTGENLKFTFNNSLDGMLKFAEEFFGIQINKLDDAPHWADGVSAYAVYDESGEVLGTFFLDPFTRPGKRGNGANYAVAYGIRDEAGNTSQLPVSTSVLNLPALTAENQNPELTQRQVETMAHEILGHLLHVTFARTIGAEHGGDKITGDLLEVASQTMEYLAKEPAIALMLTDTTIPEDRKQAFIQSRLEAQRHINAIDAMRKLRVATLDLRLNGQNISFDEAIEETNTLAEPVVSKSLFRRRQVHLGNAYAGWYLSAYLVSDVYATANTVRIRDGKYARSLGEEFRRVLELGGGPNAITQMMNFGRRGTIAPPAGGTALAGSGSASEA